MEIKAYRVIPNLLVLVFEETDPAKLAAAMERFDTEVVKAVAAP